jgi:hypothetical protein
METFATWELAHAYYSECFAVLSVHIREAHPESPIHSPARKKQKVYSTPDRLPRPKALAQPHFAPALNKNTANSFASGTTKFSTSITSDLAHSYVAPAFANSPSHERLHHGIPASAQGFQHSNQHHPDPQSPTPSPPIQIFRPRRVIVEDSSDDSVTATAGFTDTDGESPLVYPKAPAPTAANTAPPFLLMRRYRQPLPTPPRPSFSFPLTRRRYRHSTTNTNCSALAPHPLSSWNSTVIRRPLTRPILLLS